MYNFASKASRSGAWPQYTYTFADFDAKRGLLLSVRPQDPKRPIIIFDPDTDTSTEVCHGTWAVWGPDNYIYYAKGTSQLWRYKTDGTSQEPVYLAGAEPDSEDCGPMLPLRPSHDRTLLAFQYIATKPSVAGIVLIDLVKKEYRELGAGGTDLTWVVRDSDKAKELPASKANAETLLQAARDRDVKLIEFLLTKRGVDIDIKAEHGKTALITAASGSHPGVDYQDVVRYLLDKGADVNAKDELGNTPLHGAIYSMLPWSTLAPKDEKTKKLKDTIITNAMTIAKILIAKGADINARSKSGNTPLHAVVSTGNIKMAELLISKGADINAKDSEGDTPLRCAVLMGKQELAEMLKNHGAAE